MFRRFLGATALLGTAAACPAAHAESFRVELGDKLPQASYDGRVLLIFSKDPKSEPRFQAARGLESAQIFGVDVNDFKPRQSTVIGNGITGYPLESMPEIPAGTYWVQAVLNKYDTFHLSNGKVVKLPAARGAGQNWRKEPGNLISKPVQVTFDPKRPGEIKLVLDTALPPVPEPQDTEHVKYFKFKSPSLSKFWGRDTYLNAYVLLPRDFDKHPEARYPLIINHGHFPQGFANFRTTPPDPNAPCVYAARFQMDCYNRIQEQEAYDFYQKWASPDFPRMLIIEIDHSNPYFDDSYAVNSENLGPYGDAIQYEFIPALEKKFRGIGQGWARFVYGGSTGGWIALAAQVKYPDEYNGAFASCPDSIDFRQTKVINIYDDDNAYYKFGMFGSVPIPINRDYLGHVNWTVEQENRYERVIGDKSRSGGQWDIWEAVYSPMGEDGYPKRIWDKTTGKIDKSVAAYWRENYDLRHIMERDWATLGPKLRGKIHLYVGDMDNFYLNNAVYLTEEFLKKTSNPPADAEVAYGDRAEHCWNGDPTQPNGITRLRYNSMYVSKIMKRIADTAPAGADVTSWRYK
ncbi:alpha/beta hydrolase-fold protein [Sphingomonas sp.]|uniref:alpha/beta hydrolase-fold protein n=1 Tax=Sphingomonas sp. TaxID=28214 RepID=UPI002C6E6645|nr:alpha/beta hydrolase-fold protein [Sphingomonas sp.]HWK35187.1 alpha/beta hydrolase-fold protein [Sphingomonas sp.]